MNQLVKVASLATISTAIISVAGCPGANPLEVISGGVGDSNRLGTVASVTVLSPNTNLAIAGGTPVEVNWSATATTNFSSLSVIIDPDTDPDNDNETIVVSDLAVTETRELIDTSRLAAGRYNIGVLLEERNQVSTFDYANGQIIVNQATQLFFNSPRDNFVYDRTSSVTPRFDVDWTMFDPDSVVTVRILLDPDGVVNGDEFLLRESSQQTGDRFTFNLPTGGFAAGTYRIVAVVDDGIAATAIYAPGSIRLRSRLAGPVDLRDLDLPSAPIQGAIFEGFNPRDNTGSFISAARDLDRDGFGDFMLVSQFGKPSYISNSSRTGVGEAYIVYGRQSRFSGSTNINSASTLFRTRAFAGPNEAVDPIRPSRGITSFAVLSDWDGDGFRDLAFGMPFTDSVASTTTPLDSDGYFRSGVVVVVSSIALRPQTGFAGSGDVENLSNIASLPHVARVDNNINCPQGYVGPKAPLGVAGSGLSLFWRYISNPATLPHEEMGCRFSSNEAFDAFGETIGAFQYNGLIMAAPNRDPGIASLLESSRGTSFPGAGTVSIYYNNSGRGFYPWRATNVPAANPEFNYPGLQDPPNPERLPHHGPYHYIVHDARFFQLGNRLLYPASPGYRVEEDSADSPCDGAESHEDLDLGSAFVLLYGRDRGGRLGNVSAVDDFNGDGVQDVLLGYPFGLNGAGEVFITFGRVPQLVTGGELSLDELRLPQSASGNATPRIFDGVRIVGNPGERLGQTQDRAGDFNSDGLGDVLIGSPLLNNRRGGALVLFGTREAINQTDADLAFEQIVDRGLGVVFIGESEGDLAGARVTSAGDVDGDGNDDIMIAAPDRSVTLDLDLDGVPDVDRGTCGVVYLVYGSPDLRGELNLADIGTEKLPGALFIGRNSGDQLGATIGEQGDRSIGLSAAGDVDADGLQDLLLSSSSASPRGRARAGEAYLIYGQGD
ncbi:MAG: hypothetical protein ACKVS9_18880 [Phycisphaerae bacterium]